MPRAANPEPKKLEQYEHRGKERLNNPPVGLVTPETDRMNGRTTYAYDWHLDPQLIWSGKVERRSFGIPKVSLHVHERIDPRTIIESVRKRDGVTHQKSLFEFTEENPPLREAIEFYKHKHNWSNRLIAGDSLLVMNSLLEKEGMAGKIQMVYMDPPYGIKYGSNFQPFINQRKVKDGNDESLTQEPETIQAFRDTWELGLHSYLTYLRDRLLLAHQLLSESGSIFVQISDANVHHVRELLDEVFGSENFVMEIRFQTRTTEFTRFIPTLYDYLLWYARDKHQAKCHQLFYERPLDETRNTFDYVELTNGTIRPLTAEEKSGEAALPKGSRLFKPAQVDQKAPEQIQRLRKAGRLAEINDNVYFKRYADDFPLLKYSNNWDDTVWSTFSSGKMFVVQTHHKTIERCILMTTDPGDLVLDPTCGSGTTAYCAEKWGRRWVTCDTSRVALTIAKQRLMTSSYEYYQLANPVEGISSGLTYKRVRHVTLGSIASGDEPEVEEIYDQPEVNPLIIRISGPFTLEAVPSPVVHPLAQVTVPVVADASIARSGETALQNDWRDELLKTGIRGKGGQKIDFSRVEPSPGTRWLHADGDTREATPRRIVVSFGPRYGPLEPRQVALAVEEAQSLVPRPKIVAFVAFQFDPEASKDIDETDWPGVTLLKVQMNADLLTEDLKKQRASNESFWLIGQPDVRLEIIKGGKDKGKCRIEVLGFDYYNTKTGAIESGGADKIAMWMLDPDYDGRSLFPRQVFFPMTAEKGGWAGLRRSLRTEIDERLIEQYQGTVSIPFVIGPNRRVGIKIVDDRGIESLKIVEVD